VTQKQDIKRQKDKFQVLKQEAEVEKEKAKSAARERVILEFEKEQRHLGAATGLITTSGAEAQESE
jgi:nitric oxide synthase-interacting protein